jgi:hypothetical protein
MVGEESLHDRVGVDFLARQYEEAVRKRVRATRRTKQIKRGEGVCRWKRGKKREREREREGGKKERSKITEFTTVTIPQIYHSTI